MPTIFNPKRRNAIFINTGGTVSPTPAPPSFSNTKSLSYDGIDEYVSLGTPSFLNATSEFTSSLWFNTNDVGTQTTLWAIGSSASQLWVISKFEDDLIIYGGTSAKYYRKNNLFSINTWYNLIVVYDGSQANADRFKAYLNGVLLTGATINGTIETITPTFTTDFNIGRIGYAAASYFNGNIDEVALWNTALSPTDISTIATAPSDLSSYNPVAWYRMGDNSTYQTPQILMPENTNKNKVSNYSLSFDGVDDVVTLNSTVSFASEFTLSIWVKPTGLNNNQVILGDGSSSNNWIRLSSASSITFKIAATSLTFADVGNNLVDGVWQHLLFYRDSSNNVGIFRNGAIFSTTQNNTNTLELTTIGKRGSIEYTGLIDEIAFYTTDQSANASSIYNSGTPTTIPSGATAYWKLGEQSKFTDNWLVPNSALSNYSKFSFNFDGVDDYIDIGNGISFNYNDPFTISTWVNVDAVSGTKAIYNKYDSSISGGRGIALNLFSSSGSGLNLIYFDLYSTNSGSTSTRKRITTRSTDFIINPDIWYLITITYDGSGLGSGIKMYLNGVSKSVTITQDNLQSGDITNSLNAHVGATTTPSLFFNGTMDEVAIWDSALNSTQVTELYNGGEPTTISGGLAHWRMGEDATYNSSTSQWTIPDQVGSNDGTSSNTMALNTLVGEAPNYFGGGVSDAMTIEDRVGDAPNSSNNSVSFNMESTDIDNNTP